MPKDLLEELTIETKRPPRDLLANISKPFLPKLLQVEEKISKRPDAWQRLMEEIETPLPTEEMTGFKRYLFTPKKAAKIAVTGLKTLAVPFQRGEAAIASAALEAQKDITKPVEIAKGFWKGISGQRPAELGDLIRTTGFGGWLNEPVSKVTGFFGSVGLTNLATKGALIKGTQKIKEGIKAKIQQISERNKNYILDKTKKLSQGVDEVHQGLKNEYDDLFSKIGNKELIAQTDKIQNVIYDLPQNVVNKIARDKFIIYNPDGTIQPTINNIRRIRFILDESVPKSIWTNRQFANVDEARIMSNWRKLGNIMAEGNPELQTLNQKYHNFMDMANEINDVLLDKYGNPKANALISLFKKGGERGKQVFFEKLAQVWPQAQDIINDMVKYNKWQTFMEFLRKWTGRATLGYGAYEVGKRILRGEQPSYYQE